MDLGERWQGREKVSDEKIEQELKKETEREKTREN